MQKFGLSVQVAQEIEFVEIVVTQQLILRRRYISDDIELIDELYLTEGLIRLILL